MRSKLNYLIGVSLGRKIKSKWFLIANIIIGLLIICVINADSIIKFFGGDFEKNLEIYVIDDTNRAYDIFANQLSDDSIVLSSYAGFDVKRYEGADISEFLKDNDNSIIIRLYDSSSDSLKAEITSLAFIDTIDYQLITNALSNTKVNLNVLDSSISFEEFQKIYEDVDINRIILDENKKSDDEKGSMVMTTVFPFVILPFFMLTLFLVQMIGAEINDEKNTRSMEIIISNVSPTRHLASKVIAGNLFVIIQAIILSVFALLGFWVRNLIGGNKIESGISSKIISFVTETISSSVVDKLFFIVPLVLLLMLLTFIAYSLLAGILASMTTNSEDFQQLQTPIIVISLLGYYLSVMSSVFSGSLFIKIFSFVPFISAILSPSLFLMEQINIYDMCISICIMVLTILVLIKYGMRIYKVGILNYSSKGLWKKMFEAVRKG